MDFICYYKNTGIFWFRIFGYGLFFNDITKNPLLFSERYGYVQGLRLGKFYARILTRRTYRLMENESKESQETPGHSSRDDDRTP